MIYLHVPFCKSFCAYCDFYSEVCPANESARAQKLFADGVCREIDARREEIAATQGLRTLYVGGGTPSVLDIRDLERIGDYAENICGYAHNLADNESPLAPKLLAEMEAMRQLINKLYLLVLESYKDGKKKLSKDIKGLEANIDALSSHMVNIYITRLNQNELTGISGTDYLKFYNDTERIGDHLINLIDRDYILSH